MSDKFKHVTPENWLDPDALSLLLVKRDGRDGTVYSTDGRDWIRFISQITLSANLPENVREAYEFAVGALGYAYFYYPVFTIVSQQVLRVADFACDQFFIAREIAPHPRSFARRLKRLRQLGHIDEAQSVEWERVRLLRNGATHIDAFQHNWGLGWSLELIRDVAAAMSALPWSRQA